MATEKCCQLCIDSISNLVVSGSIEKGYTFMLDAEIQKSIKDSVLCWLATVNKHGEPNVSPKEMFIANGNEHILVANIASPNSVRNIYGNSSVSLSFIDVFRQKGFKLNGIAKIIEKNDSDFHQKSAILRLLGGEQFEIRSIIEIKVTQAFPIRAPSYNLFPDISENTLIKQAMNTYGVQAKSV